MWKAKTKNKAKHRPRLAPACLLGCSSLELCLLAVLVFLHLSCCDLALILLSGLLAVWEAFPPFLLSLFPASPPVCNSLLMLVCLIHFVLFSAEIRNSFSSESQSSEFLYLPAAAYLAAIFLNSNTLQDTWTRSSVATFQNSHKCFVKRKKFKA